MRARLTFASALSNAMALLILIATPLEAYSRSISSHPATSPQSPAIFEHDRVIFSRDSQVVPLYGTQPLERQQRTLTTSSGSAFSITSVITDVTRPDQQQLRNPAIARESDVSPTDIIPGVTGMELAEAMGIPVESVVSTDFYGSDTGGFGIGTSALGYHFPIDGGTFAIASTGLATSAEYPNNEGSLSYVLDGLSNSQGNDLVQFAVVLHVPSGVNCASFDFAFYSEEFPEFVGSGFNDTFTAELGGTNLTISGTEVIAPLNFAFDAENNPVSVNTVSGVVAPTASTYDGMTALRRAQTPAVAGDNMLLVFSVQDLGDSIYDSAVFLDNFMWTYDPSCGAGIEPPPTPQSTLQLHMPDALPTGYPIQPSVTVFNQLDAPANYDVVVELWRGFTMLDEQAQDFPFLSTGTQEYTFDFGVYAPDYYYLWVELWEGSELLEIETHPFGVGLAYLELRNAAGNLTEAAYNELNDGENIAADTLSRAAAKGTGETVDIILDKLIASAVTGLTGIGELVPEDWDFAVDELVGKALDFGAAIELGTYDRIYPHFRDSLDNNTFNQRRDSVSAAENGLLKYAVEQSFLWNPDWQAELVRREEAIRDKNETIGGLGISLDFDPPFVHRASLVQMEGQFDWIHNELLPFVEDVSTILLIGFIVVLLIATIIVLLPTGAIPAALLGAVVIAAKFVAAAYVVVLKLLLTSQATKFLLATIALALFAFSIAGTAENIVSPEVVTEHQGAMEYLRQEISGDLSTGRVPDISLSAAIKDHNVEINAQFPKEDNPEWLELQLFRGDGQILEIRDYDLSGAGAETKSDWELPSGPYWLIGVGRGGDEVETRRIGFEVGSPTVALNLTLEDSQLVLGEAVQATVTLTNQDPLTGTGALVLGVRILDGEELRLWVLELEPAESMSYEYSFVPQEEGASVLRATVSDEHGAVEQIDRAFAVGEAAAIELNLWPQVSYSPEEDVVWSVSAINSGVLPTTTNVTLHTYDRNASYSVVYSDTYPLALEAGNDVTFPLHALPAGRPGAYSARLMVGNTLYRFEDFLVEAEGTLFAIVEVDPTDISVSSRVTVTTEVQNELYAPIDADVTLKLRTPDGSETSLSLEHIGQGRYQTTYVPVSAGTHELWVSATKTNYLSTSRRLSFVVERFSLLVVEVQGQLTLNDISLVTFTVSSQ